MGFSRIARTKICIGLVARRAILIAAPAARHIGIILPIFQYCPEGGAFILENRQLKITPPNQFNDPFEFSPIVECPDPAAHARLDFAKICTPAYFAANRGNFRSGLTYTQYLSELKIREVELLETMAANVRDTDRATQRHILDLVSENFGVACFTSHPLHPLMWAHYGASHRGLVLEFDETHPLFTSSSFFKVDYSDTRARCDASGPVGRDTAENFAKRKSRCWSYEDESRLIVDLSATEPFKVPGCDEIRVLRIEPTLIRSVIVGTRASDGFKRRVKNALESTDFAHVNPFGVRTDETKFELHKTPL